MVRCDRLALSEGVVPGGGARGCGRGLGTVAQRVEHAQDEAARPAQPPLHVTCNKCILLKYESTGSYRGYSYVGEQVHWSGIF